MCKTKLDEKKKVKRVDQSDSEPASDESTTTEEADTSQSDTGESLNRIYELRDKLQKLTVKATSQFTAPDSSHEQEMSSCS